MDEVSVMAFFPLPLDVCARKLASVRCDFFPLVKHETGSIRRSSTSIALFVLGTRVYDGRLR